MIVQPTNWPRYYLQCVTEIFARNKMDLMETQFNHSALQKSEEIHITLNHS